MYDFHTHTKYSDGMQTPEELIDHAVHHELKAMAITDHNVFLREFEKLKEMYRNKIYLINGAELSARYRCRDDTETEVHIVALDFDSEKLRPALERNQFDRRPYYEEIRRKLRALSIDVPSFEVMKIIYPAHENIGNFHIADYMVKMGYVLDIDEALDLYLGSLGRKRAYVNPLDYASFMTMEEAVREVIEAGGVPVLAHLFSYNLPDAECCRLAEEFRKAAGKHPAGLEVFYGKYDKAQWDRLRTIADDNDLYYSIASDYHGRPGQQIMRRIFLGEMEEERMIHRVLSIPEAIQEGFRWDMEFNLMYRCAMKLILRSLKGSKVEKYIPSEVMEILELYQEADYKLPEDFWEMRCDESREEASFDDDVWDTQLEFIAALRWYDILRYLINRQNGKQAAV